MSRPLRIEYAGAFYHVMNRGAARQSIFLDPLEHRSVFLDVLADAVNLWKIRIHAYSMMDNHYHLLIETPLANLSRAMRHIDGVFTQRVNRKIRRDGALFRGRFKSILVQQESYFLELVRYIHLNGVRAVQYPNPRLDPNCSHGVYLGIRKNPSWLTTDLALSHFDSERSGVEGRFDEFVRAGVSSELAEILGRKRWPAMLGLKPFIMEIRERFKLAKPAHREKPQERELRQVGQLRSDDVLRRIAAMFETRVENIICPGSKKLAMARHVSMYILRRVCHLTYDDIGKILGNIGSSAVVYGINQMRRDVDRREMKKKVAEEFGISEY